jgi:hypothetical protein
MESRTAAAQMPHTIPAKLIVIHTATNVTGLSGLITKKPLTIFTLKGASSRKSYLDYLFKSQIRSKLRNANTFLILKIAHRISTNF